MAKENKICSICSKSFPGTEEYFYAHNTGGLYTYCKKCSVKKSSKWKKDNPEKSKAMSLKYINNEDKFIWYTIKRPFKPSCINPPIQKNFTRKGWKPEITVEGMYEELMLHIQLMKEKIPGSDGRLCRYCEQPWTYTRTGRGGKVVWTNFSMDRFDSQQTYKKGNVVFCCSGCNSIKNNSGKKHWLKFLEIDKELNG